MGRQTQNRHISGMTHNKTNPSFKWGRMFHLLDYHHWYYVKKVLANKKHHEGSNIKDVENHYHANTLFGGSKGSLRESAEKTQVQDQSMDACLSTESPSSTSTPRKKISPTLETSPSTKSSRATRIKKMIAREVSKRRGRHRRSSTCPVSTELVGTNNIHDRLEANEDGHVDNENIEIRRHNMNEGENTCGLCNTMKIECQLGDKQQVGNQGELPLDHMNTILQENSNQTLNKLHNHKHIRRSVSLQQTTDFMDVKDAMSKSKRYFLRIIDDSVPFKKNNYSNGQVETSTKGKPLKRSGTFPNNVSSCTKDGSFDVAKLHCSSHNKENIYKYAMLEKTTSFNDRQVPRIRFKDLKQKIKHVIKESKKDRHIIAMDAVLHRVPYGQKVPEESAKDSPCVSTCESDVSFSPNSNKDINHSYKRRSPSLDESLDKYCHLFETTSSSKEVKTDTHSKLRLRVMDDNSNITEKKRLGRMFSFPDIQLFLSNQYEYSHGDVSTRMLNRRIMSFNEYRYRDTEDDRYYAKEYLEDDVNINNKKNSISFDYKDDNIGERSSQHVIRSNSFEMMSSDNDDDARNTQRIERESVTTSITEVDVHLSQETSLEGSEPILQEEISKPEQLFNEPTTFPCTKIDEKKVKSSLDHVSPSLHHVHVDINDIEEYNYVRDILQLSGYLDSELLGMWYSSEQPMDPSIFVEFESYSILDPKFPPLKQGLYNNHLLLFDLINEILVVIYERSVSYWCAPLCPCSRTHPMPKGYRILNEVWGYIKWYMSCSKPELDLSLDCITICDLAKDDKWMNLQFDAECIGLEVEDLIFEDLVNEITS